MKNLIYALFSIFLRKKCLCLLRQYITLKPYWVKSNLVSTIHLPPSKMSLSFLGRVVWDVKIQECLWKLSKSYVSLLNFECSSLGWDWDQNNCLVFMTDWLPVTPILNRDLVTNGKQLNDYFLESLIVFLHAKVKIMEAHRWKSMLRAELNPDFYHLVNWVHSKTLAKRCLQFFSMYVSWNTI